MNNKEKLIYIFDAFMPTIVWASIILGMVIYEIEVLFPLIKDNGLFIKNIGYAPFYIAISLYFPFRVSHYFKIKTRTMITRYRIEQNR